MAKCLARHIHQPNRHVGRLGKREVNRHLIGGRIRIDRQILQSVVVLHRCKRVIVHGETFALIPVIADEMHLHAFKVDGVNAFRHIIDVKALVQRGRIGGVVIDIHEVAVAEVELRESECETGHEVMVDIPSAVRLGKVFLAVLGTVGEGTVPHARHIGNLLARTRRQRGGIGNQESVMFRIIGITNKRNEHAVGNDGVLLGRFFRTGEGDFHAALHGRAVVDGHVVAFVEVEAVEAEIVCAGSLRGHHPRAVRIGIVGTHGLGAIRHISEAGGVALMTLALRGFQAKQRTNVDERLRTVVEMHGASHKIVDGIEAVGGAAPTVVQREEVIFVVAVQDVSMAGAEGLRTTGIIHRTLMVNLVAQNRKELRHGCIQESASIVSCH